MTTRKNQQLRDEMHLLEIKYDDNEHRLLEKDCTDAFREVMAKWKARIAELVAELK